MRSGGKNSDQIRRQANYQCGWLAQQCGLTFQTETDEFASQPGTVQKIRPGQVPRSGCYRLIIVDKKVEEGTRADLNGKAETCLLRGIRVIIDDSADVCRECTERGIVAYQVKHKSKKWRKYFSEAYHRASLPDLHFEAFPQAVEAFLQERREGTVDRRWEILRNFYVSKPQQGKASSSGKQP